MLEQEKSRQTLEARNAEKQAKLREKLEKEKEEQNEKRLERDRLKKVKNEFSF